MPELPDLAVMATRLEQKLAHHKLIDLKLHVDRKCKSSEQELKEAFVGHSLKQVFREGKELRFEFAGGNILGLHLMLHGEIRLVNEDEETKFPILQLDFKDNILFLTDWQKQATPTLNPEKSAVPDALEINAKWLKDVLAKKKTDVKTVLLDQKIVRGIGNSYSDEILYDAGISPLSIANVIPEKQVEVLAKSIHKVLTEEIKNLMNASEDLIIGENRDFLKVHLPKTKTTKKGEEILISQKGSRKTYYVESQKRYE
ncbi:DNA-formamidopyrimidine glycosylase family protein [Pedobacter agri]|uniref:DNA-formamidopyrimidine glycosylase family protein n=1 Tax=Pedobacter agri TaxID=454586 RepID=UPI00293033B8|nr:DNA-formamidopyrimidine glycosylase family protein [Pedobacter agri]